MVDFHNVRYLRADPNEFEEPIDPATVVLGVTLVIFLLVACFYGYKLGRLNKQYQAQKIELQYMEKEKEESKGLNEGKGGPF